MFIRTFLRTLFNAVFKNNIIINAAKRIVNFYCNLFFNAPNFIKFTPNLPINDIEKKKILFFQSVTGDKIDCK